MVITPPGHPLPPTAKVQQTELEKGIKMKIVRSDGDGSRCVILPPPPPATHKPKDVQEIMDEDATNHLFAKSLNDNNQLAIEAYLKEQQRLREKREKRLKEEKEKRLKEEKEKRLKEEKERHRSEEKEKHRYEEKKKRHNEEKRCNKEKYRQYPTSKKHDDKKNSSRREKCTDVTSGEKKR